MSRTRIQRFEVVAELGTGGMGTVYRARDPHLQRDVAIKVLAQRGEPPAELSSVRTVDLRAPATTSEDLLAEARVMAQLSHPNLLPVFEVGLDGREVFLVMELVEGSNLRSWLQRRPPRAAVMRAFADAARGLAAAHARGIVHRDFKPDNVLIGDDGRVRVADFGLSLLDPGGDQLIEWGDVAGTPDYMAPEQLHGAPATPQSDVYAFARALAEALTGVRGDPAELEDRLRAAGVAAELRGLIRDGLADDPDVRPSLATFLAELEGRRRPRWYRPALAAAALAGAALLGTVTPASGESLAACERSTAAYGVPWSAAQRAELVPVVGEEVAALVDRRFGELATDRHAACVARRAGETTAAETASWLSCVERRRVELATVVRRAGNTKTPNRRKIGEIVFGIVADCRGHTDPPLPDPPEPALALLERYIHSLGLGRARQVEAHGAIERDAAALGERELEARAAFSLAQGLRDADRLKDAVAAWDRSHKIASEIHAPNLEVRALVDNANISSGRGGDPSGAKRLVTLARELMAKPEVTDWNRASVALADARVLGEQSDYHGALAQFAQARKLLDRSGWPVVWAELTLRTDEMHALLMLPERRAEAVERGREAVDYATQVGDKQGIAVSLNLYGIALENVDRLAEATAASEKSLAAYREYLPPTNATVIHARRSLAQTIMRQGRYGEARDMLHAALAASEGNEMLRSERDELLRALALSEFNLGNFDAAMSLFQQALEECVAAHGKDHLLTLRLLEQYADYALDAGRLEDATTRFAQALAGYRKRDDTSPLTIARIEGRVGVGIALSRDRPAEAEALARKALETLRGVSDATPGDRDWIEDGLAQALLGQQRWQEALETAEAALADGRAAGVREELLAVMQLRRARALYELGHKTEAREIAAAARDLLAKAPGQRTANKEAAELVERLRR